MTALPVVAGDTSVDEAVEVHLWKPSYRIRFGRLAVDEYSTVRLSPFRLDCTLMCGPLLPLNLG